ncbi:MAG: branched-chain amino acid ABC transporter permease, partial [Pseudomonadota bacterium]
MTEPMKNTLLFALVAGLIVIVGFQQSWNSALLIIQMGLISAIMALGVNLQWGFAGLFNVGIMGFVALGGLAAILIGMPPTEGAFATGGWGVLGALVLGAGTIIAAIMVYRRLTPGWPRSLGVLAILVLGFFLFRGLLDPAVDRIED